MVTTRTIPDHLWHLPTYHGLPVPWVAIWSDEKAEPIGARPLGPDGGIVATGPNVEMRFGMIWVATNKRTGTPVFGEVNSQRQRRCMLGPRCQVCGARIDGPPVWLIPDLEEHGPVWRERRWTVTPPVCVLCADTSLLWCPHLQAVPPIRAQGYGRPVAACGDLFVPGEGWRKDAAVALEAPIRRNMVGRMIAVEVADG
jgi:hypothetical protein